MNTDMVTQLIPGHGLRLKGRELQNYITAEVKRMRAGEKDYHLTIPAGWEKSERTINDIVVEEFRTTSRSNLVMLQFHGGGYTGAMHDKWRVSAILQASLIHAKAAYCVNYRLAPTYVYPAALEDALAVYHYIRDHGTNAKDIILIGDSAGGNLAIETAMFLRDHDIGLPRALLLQSPWVDLGTSQTSRTSNKEKDQILGRTAPLYPEILKPSYAGSLSVDDPRLSPINGNLAGLPPMLIQTGGNEIFLSEDEEFAHKAARAGVHVTLSIYPGMPHNFAICLPELEESVQSEYEIRDFVRRF
ncbi:alpha/beta hydrolase [uncultured Megasphaera sp.]|jgi:monoterpene epsilon-lactone hydrolase|uniref:alpha/beta hydrolase n=1 Tax=uncultured Megasphaera sp. TaxID=165188 RepID=UPI0025F29A91|nr:alpha/beta hydrolase [uncultured Megasphaera sp.]